MDLPSVVELIECRTGKGEYGAIETLSRESAKNLIDSLWWKNLGSTLHDVSDEPDSDWEWRMLVSRYQNKPFFQAKCVKSTAGFIEAAILFQVNALSVIVPGQPALFVDRLAAAPRNREMLVAEPVYRGGGTGLLTYAIAQSYSLGFGGRVNLVAVANEDFYANRGFEKTNEEVEDGPIFELPEKVAVGHLVEKGLIDG